MKFTLQRFGAREVDVDPQSTITFPLGSPQLELQSFENCFTRKAEIA